MFFPTMYFSQKGQEFGTLDYGKMPKVDEFST